MTVNEFDAAIAAAEAEHLAILEELPRAKARLDELQRTLGATKARLADLKRERSNAARAKAA